MKLFAWVQTIRNGLNLRSFSGRALTLALGLFLPAVALADDFDTPPVTPAGQTAPPYNEQTFSIGVYRMTVDTNNSWWTLLTGYPGFNITRYTLTGPICFDFNTQLGRSKAYPHGNSIFGTGIQVGHTPSTTEKTADFSYIPPFFQSPSATATTRKLYTELRSMVLTSVGLSGCSNKNPALPSYDLPSIPAGYNLVTAGAL